LNYGTICHSEDGRSHVDYFLRILVQLILEPLVLEDAQIIDLFKGVKVRDGLKYRYRKISLYKHEGIYRVKSISL
jgi:hypothetical protein